jgi:hypothetical protein
MNNLIILILAIIALLAIFSTIEPFCNCVGLGWKTPKPTYYVYRPTGDVSNYGGDYISQMAEGQFMTVGSQPMIYPEQNLGWRTGMPYDYFADHMKSNNWAAGANPNPANSSVPLLATQQLNSAASNMNNGGYLRNYGSQCAANANNMVMMTPFAEGLKFVNGPSGYPNMLSDGTPQYEGPAGSFSDAGYANACPSANAYNLGVGVL